MRKLLFVSVVTVLPAFGCGCITEPIRRLEVWKQQTFFTAPQPVVAAPYGAVCGPQQAAGPACGPTAEIGCGPTAEIGCGQTAEIGCGQALAVPASTAYPPDAVISGPEETLPGPVLTEESDGILKQP